MKKSLQLNDPTALASLRYGKDGLIPAVVQDANTEQVLILAYMNEESLKKTLDTGLACFWSRSRSELWTKGETSGNYLHVQCILYDCDDDALVVQVLPVGPACHTGETSCFYRTLASSEGAAKPTADVLSYIEQTVYARKENPKEGSYTNYLLDCGIDKICKKVGEEATETVIAAKNEDKNEIAAEAADLLYHLTVLLASENMHLNDVYAVLEARHGKVSEIKNQGKAKRGEY